MKMARLKYKWIVLVIVCITMLACDSESRDFGPNAISFGSNRRSIYKESLDNINAILWGYKGDDVIFDGVDACLYETAETVNGCDIYIKSDTKYWSLGTYSFFSVSPKLGNATVNDNIFEITNFDISSQMDVVVAEPDPIVVDRLEYNVPVNLNYKHVFTKIKFKAQVNTGVGKITSFRIVVPKKASYTSATDKWNVFSPTETCELLFEPLGGKQISTTSQLLDIAPNDAWLIFPSIVVDDAIFYEITYSVDDETQTQTGKLPALEDGGMSGVSYVYQLYIKTTGEIQFGDIIVNPWEQSINDLIFNIP